MYNCSFTFNQVAAARCIKSRRYVSRASGNVYVKHQDEEKLISVTLTVAWMLASVRLLLFWLIHLKFQRFVQDEMLFCLPRW